MAKRKTIWSICGTCAAAAAYVLIERHGLKRIEISDFPNGAPLVDDHGSPALFAIAMDSAQRREFDLLYRDMLA